MLHAAAFALRCRVRQLGCTFQVVSAIVLRPPLTRPSPLCHTVHAMSSLPAAAAVATLPSSSPTTLLALPSSHPVSPACRKYSWRDLSTLSLSLLGSRGPKVPLVWLVLAACGWVGWLAWQRDRLRRKQLQHQRNLELYWSKFHSSLRFGFDIGGTLCKLVYFEPDVVSADQADVKQRVDQFIKGSITYGQTGNRDAVLQFSCRQIHGTFHFLKFQTSMMANFIDIVKAHNLSPVHNQHTPPLPPVPSMDADASKERSRSVGGRRLSSTGKGMSPALVSSSAAVLSFSTAQSMLSTSAHTLLLPVSTAATSTARDPRAGRPKLGATAWYTLTDPASPPLAPIVPGSSSSGGLLLDDSGDALSTSTSHALLSPASTSAAAHFPISDVHVVNGVVDAAQHSARPPAPSSSIRSLTEPDPPHSVPSTSVASTTTSDPSTSTSSSSASSSASSSSAVLSSLPASSSAASLLAAPPHSPLVCGTGGGAYKFASVFRSALSIDLEIMDELESLVRGIDFMIHTVPDECYYLSQFLFKLPLQRQTHPPVSYPYLVCNIGSGVSILKVSGPHQFERVGGTSLGGGTFLGLCRALTGCESFEDALLLAERGHSSAVDLLVGDIYGGDYEQLGLAKENVAASFGKLVRSSGDMAVRDVRREDLAKAALVMITNNISSLVNLYAHQVLHVPQMIFVGNFLTHNEIAKRGLAFATDYWSQQTAKALFLRHEGYFGAVGSLLA